ncbi:hypothetical protein LJC54_01325 [Parabacteroides sp. OttesenSCG-928-J18]|nr:hypothetical protein [Parabacteroides sp. OttesenSCG-928-J18]
MNTMEEELVVPRFSINRLEPTTSNPSKCIYYLDGVLVEEETVKERVRKGEQFEVSGDTRPRYSIIRYGEKHRNGILFVKSKK